MAKQNVSLLAFNRGIISPLSLARVDIDRLTLSAELQTNWMPRTLGSMSLRPGQEYITATKSNNKAEYIPFIYSSSDTALLEITDSVMRVIVDGSLVSRESISTTITNGLFTTDLTGWTDDDDAGGVSSWGSAGTMNLVGNGFDSARRYQALTIGASDQNVEHAITVNVTYGPVTLKVGTASDDDTYLSEVSLKTGVHSLTFTPTSGTAYVTFSNREKYPADVDSIAIESSGTLEIAAPWSTSDLGNLRWDQSADVIFIACSGFQQRRIERRSNNSWSIVNYEPLDGPFRTYNQTGIRLTPDDITGEITVTSSANFFQSAHVGAIFRIDSVGQKVEQSVTAEDQFSGYIRVTGVGTTRSFTVTRAGTWSATVTLQRSVAEPGAWVDVNTYTGNGSSNYNDNLDNQIIYYRIGVKAGDYTSGTPDLTLEFSGGTRTGIFQVTGYTSVTEVTARVIVDLGGTDATTAWAEGVWSSYRGHPTSVALYEGRLWWAGKDRIAGSVSDGYESFDDEVLGDSGPIVRNIGAGPVDTINWLLPLQRLIVGTDSSEKSTRSTTFDEPLTPTNINLKDASTQGSSFVAPAKIDKTGVFVQRSGSRVYQMNYDLQDSDYITTDLSVLAPDIGKPSVVKIVVQRQPDTRIHCIRSDGKVAIHVFDRIEEVSCWVLYETDGEVETAAVLPGTEEDEVYYQVKRTINGSTVRYLEKWALESDCVGGATNKLVDSFYAYSGASTTTITGLDHLEGETVAVWGASKDLSTYTVSSGSITLSEAVTEAYVGLPYTADYKSSKLAYAASLGTALCQKKKVNQLGLILSNTHYQGLKYGPDFDNLDDMPLTEGGTDVADDTIHADYDEEMFAFPGEWDTDSRLCLRAAAPRPCTVLAAVISVQTNDKG